MLRILIIHCAGFSDLPSGELVVAQQEARYLKKYGIDSKLHIVKGSGRSLISMLITGLKAYSPWHSYRLMKKMLDEFRPDVVHFHCLFPFFSPLSLCACKVRNIPVIHTLHNFRWLCVEGAFFRNDRYCDECLKGSGFKGVICSCAKSSHLISLAIFLNNIFYNKFKLFFPLVDKFIAVSNFVKGKYVKAGFPEGKIIVKYNTVFSLPESRYLTEETERNGVTFVGRLSKGKGLGIVKDVIKGVDLPFNIIGSGPELEDLRSFCKKNNFSHVIFFGNLPHKDVLEKISKSKCVILPSICAEACSLVMLESFFCATPVIASRIGSLEEIISNSHGGILVDPDKPQDFIREIKNLISSQQRMKELGEAGRAFFKEYLSPESSINSLVKIYEDAINQKKN